MKRISALSTIIFTIVFFNCDGSSGSGNNCNRLSCIPDTAVRVPIQDTGQSVTVAQGGINGIVVYHIGNTYRAYDLQDPDKCALGVNTKLKISDDGLFLISDSSERYFLENGQPTKGISCRPLIRYRVSIQGQIIEVSN